MNILVFRFALGDSYGIVNFFNVSSDNFRLIANNNNITSNVTATGEWWRVLNGNVVTKGGDFNSIMSNTFGYDGNGKPYFYGNLDLYNNSNSIIWETDIPVQPPFVAPVLYPNANDDQSALTSGQFTFFIVNPGSLTPDDTILLNFYNTTYSDSQYDVVGSYELNRNSAFFQWTNIAQTEFQYVITARFLDWFQIVNGLSYKAQLGYIENEQTQYTYYTWTMSLTATEEQTERDKTQQEINAGINELNNNINQTNNFLTNDNFDQNTIIENIPDLSEELQNLPYDNFIETLFDNLRIAFTSTEPINFEFVLPFSNGQKIVFSSDYISSHCPQVIITLIRAFYWYIIARFILKDVWLTIDKMRQGVWFSGASEDIKTEVL